MKIAFSGASLMRFRITYTNWPTVRSCIGTVQHARHNKVESYRRTDGTRYFFLSIVGMSVLSAFSQMTYDMGYGVRRYAAFRRSVSGMGLTRATTYGYPVGILLPDALSLRLALVYTAGRRMSSDRTSASMRHIPKGCSSLNLDLMLNYDVEGDGGLVL